MRGEEQGIYWVTAKGSSVREADRRNKGSTGKPDTASNYRNPPAEHRFKPGQSGNLAGRPKKKPILSFDASKAGTIFDRNDQVLLEVASRPILLREGDKTETVSGLEALYRSMLRNAAQGDAATGRILLQMLERAESRRAAYQQEVMVAAQQHLATWNPVFYERELRGLPPPEVYPHPADIEINLVTGQAIFHGPVTMADAANQEALKAITFQSLRRLVEVEGELEKDPENAELKAERKRLKPFEDVFKNKIGPSNMRREVWRRAQAALSRSYKPPEKKQTRKKRPTKSKAE